MSSDISFRKLLRDDFILLRRWLSDEEVLKWYGKHHPTLASIEEKYGPRIDGLVPVHVYITDIDGQGAGLIQTYRVEYDAQYASVIGAERDWAGLDYFIGEPKFRGKRLAHQMIGSFLKQVVEALPRVSSCVSGPAPDNIKSIRSLKRCGFTFLRDVEESPGELAHLMIKRLGRAR